MTPPIVPPIISGDFARVNRLIQKPGVKCLCEFVTCTICVQRMVDYPGDTRWGGSELAQPFLVEQGKKFFFDQLREDGQLRELRVLLCSLVVLPA